MSPSVHIRTRITKHGKSYQVRYRLGGRDSKLVNAGSFKTLKDARTRRDFVVGEIAAGRDPAASLRTLATVTAPKTLAQRFDEFSEHRVDVGPKARALYRNARDSLGDLGDLEPSQITVALMQGWVAANKKLSPKTLTHYLSSIRQVFDYCDVQPNPARDRKVRLPAADLEEPNIPTGVEFGKITAAVSNDLERLALRVLEATGLRIGELAALTWGDVDFDSGRFRVSRARTKGRTAGQRWLLCPPVLLDELEGLLPFEDRGRDRRVFHPLSDDRIRNALAGACKTAGAAHYSPHDLRHRRVSLWFAHGFDSLVISRWAGHTRPSMSSDVYGHVIASDDEWAAFWQAAYVAERVPRVAQVRPKASESEVKRDG